MAFIIIDILTGLHFSDAVILFCRRRPLTVLKSQNVHCTCARSTSVSEDATSIPKMKSQSIPRESVVLPKPGAQMDSQTSDPVDNLPVKKKSSRRSQKEMSDFAIGTEEATCVNIYICDLDPLLSFERYFEV